jgi:hypothetical protein
MEHLVPGSLWFAIIVTSLGLAKALGSYSALVYSALLWRRYFVIRIFKLKPLGAGLSNRKSLNFERFFFWIKLLLSSSHTLAYVHIRGIRKHGQRGQSNVLEWVK